MGRASAFTVVLVAALTLAGGCMHRADGSPGSPLAVALVQRGEESELVAVDLSSFTVRRRVRLRSLCLSIDGDEATGRVITAQCGGPDRLADAACGIWDPQEGRRPRYVALDVPNPLSVVASGGSALLLHGFEQPQGLRTSVVDVVRGSVTATGHAPAAAAAPAELGTAWVVPVATSATTGSAGLAGFVGATATKPVIEFPAAGVVTAFATEQGSHRRAYAVTREGAADADAPTWRLHRLEVAEGGMWAIRASRRLDGVEHGVHAMVATPDALFLADADGVDLADPGRYIRVLGTDDFEEQRRIEVRGMPAALASWGDALLVFDGITGELLEYVPGSSVAGRSLALGAGQLGSGDLVVFDSGDGVTDERAR